MKNAVCALPAGSRAQEHFERSLNDITAAGRESMIDGCPTLIPGKSRRSWSQPKPALEQFEVPAIGFPMDDTAYLNPPAMLPAILDQTVKLAFPMASEPRTGALLRVLAASKPGGRLLELGTGTGLSTAWLLDGMDRAATLISVDVDSKVQAVAKEFLGTDPRLRLVTADAGAFLRQQVPGSFDLVFADAMPGKFEFLDEALGLLRPGGLYIVDDMLPQANWTEDHAPKIPRLMADLARRPGFRLVTLAWSSGLAVLARSD